MLVNGPLVFRRTPISSHSCPSRFRRQVGPPGTEFAFHRLRHKVGSSLSSESAASRKGIVRARHFRFADNNITEHIDDGRRVSSYFVPIAQPKKKFQQTPLYDDFETTAVEPNKEINQIRQKVKLWRDRDYPNITTVTRELLSHWTAFT